MGAIEPYLYLGWNPWPDLDRVLIDAGGRLPQGFRAAFAADFHIRDSTQDSYIVALCDMLRGMGADLLLLGGDYGESRSAARRLFAALRPEAYPCGACAVVGNNDREVFADLDELRDIAHMPLLVNECVRISVGGGTLAVGGVDEMKYGCPDARGLFAREDYAVLLSHYPVIPDFGEGGRADLVLSGHTHGGQVNLFGLTTYSFGLERERPPHLSGLVEYGGVKFFVSTGIGMSKIPLRVGCRPRVHLIEFF